MKKRLFLRSPGPFRSRRGKLLGNITRLLTLSLSCLLCLGQLTFSQQVPRQTSLVQPKSKLLKHDRIRLVEAVAQGKSTVSLVLAARAHQNQRVVSDVEKLNGKVQYRDDEVDYLRIELPTANVEQLSNSEALETMNLAGNMDYFSISPGEGSPTVRTTASEIPPPNNKTPPENPYLPSAAIGAPQFIAEHPTFDGRGVVVALIDSNIDWLHPDLQTAKAIDGSSVPKFADIYSAAPNAVIPSKYDNYPGLCMNVSMETEVVTTAKKIRYHDRVYAVPRDGKYRIGAFNERITDPSDDLNRDGNPPASSGEFAVLWDENINTVWVDTNQNLDFADEKGITDYHINHDIGIFGRDDPNTPQRETVGFVVQTDQRHKTVLVIPGYGSHGTGVSGAAFATRFFGGEMTGVAPGAQIISIPYEKGPNSEPGIVIESVIAAVKDPRVDIVSIEHGNFLPQNDGRSTFSTICNRLVRRYDKLIFASAGNGNDAVNGIISPADAKEVVAVGSYISNDTSSVNYGVKLSDADNISGYNSHGPTKEGGLKPDLLAPTTSLSTWPVFLAAGNRFGTYPLPVGYQIYSGTSTSSPFAAAGAALLISAAKQSGVKYDAQRLRRAIMNSARFLPKYSAEEQGVGLMQVRAAWAALKSAPEAVDIISRAPIKAALSEYLDEPNVGTGIFEREGWIAGQSEERVVSFMRTSGGSSPMKLQLRWIGNDGTFGGPSELTLALNQMVGVRISVSPKTEGVHSAILNVVDNSGFIIYRVLNTVIASNQLDAANGFTMTRRDSVDWLRSRSYFVNVPTGTPAFRVNVLITAGRVMASLTRPNGRFYYPLSPSQIAMAFTQYQTGGSWSRVISNPDPGVWQITVDNCDVFNRPKDDGRAAFEVTAALLGVSPIGERTVGLTLDSEMSTRISFSNTHAVSNIEETTSPLASVFRSSGMFKPRELSMYNLEVVAGCTEVGATVEMNQKDLQDVGLYLFDCTGRECVLRDWSSGPSASKRVAVQSPAPGRWKVILDPGFVRPGEHSYQYKDYMLHPAFGHVSLGGSSSEVGATVVKPVIIKVDATPLGDRFLEALVFIKTEVGPNSFDKVSPQGVELYYARQAILGVAEIGIKTSRYK